MMKKATYIQPTIKIVAFTVESGYAASPLGANTTLADRMWRHTNDYATGERYTEYTDNGGDFSMGRWE